MLKYLTRVPRPLHLASFSLAILVAAVWALAAGSPTPAQAQDSQVLPTVEPSTRSPAASSNYEVVFITREAISPLSGRIVMELHEDIRVPRSIPPNGVRVHYRTSDNSGVGSGYAANVALANQNDPTRPTVIDIVHAIQVNDNLVAIPAGSEVTVNFTRDARISNPTEGGAFSWKVGSGNAGVTLADANHPDAAVRRAFASASASEDNADVGLLVDREIQLSHEEAGRGQSITVIARGYKNGRTLTVWRDANFNGSLDTDEVELCNALVEGNDIAYCQFTLSVPPFAPGLGACGDQNGSGQVVSVILNCNFINASDASSGSSILVRQSPNGQEIPVREADQVLDLVGTLKTATGPSGGIELEVVDFPAGVISAVTIGGLPADVGQLEVGDTGRLFFIVPVPNGLPLGRHYLRVVVDRTDGACLPEPDPCFYKESVVDVSQPLTMVRAFPLEVVANQRISLSGVGFSDAGGVTITEMKIGAHTLDRSRINGGGGYPRVTRDGNWSGYVDLPIVSSTTEPGPRKLYVTDSLGRTGSVELEVAPRSATITPLWASPGSIVTVTGTGFPSRNIHGSSVPISISYNVGGHRAVSSTEADVGGNFAQDFRIPLATPAPSSPSFTVDFFDDDGTRVVIWGRHTIAGASVGLSPPAGPPGTTITMYGWGFRPFIQLSSVNFGGVEMTSGVEGMTDGNGRFTINVTAPAMGAGSHFVSVTVLGARAGADFQLLPPALAQGESQPVDVGFEGLGDHLVRVFHFNDDTKQWTFYDPELDVENTLTHMVAGESYLVLVSNTTEAILNARTRTLSCHQETCWNMIVW